jgi:hypothetical protein
MWSFDGADISGATAYDRSPVGTNHGTIIGAVPTIGKKGQALEFDGVDDYVTVANADSLNPTNITLSSWVKTSTSGKYVVSKQLYYGPVMGCLSSDTFIATENGSQAIKNLKIGDLVYSFNLETKKNELKEVINVISTPIAQVENKYYHIYFFNQDIKATYNHKFYVNGEWIMARDLIVGDELTDISGQQQIITNIVIEENFTDYVWDIEVADNHTFYANNILVHNPVSNMSYSLDTTGGGQFKIINNGTPYIASATTDINDNQWHYLVGTYDGSTMKCYVDGSLEGTNTSFSGNLPVRIGDLRIGADYDTTPGNFFNGSIDEVRVYNRALSAAEVGDLYRLGTVEIRR